MSDFIKDGSWDIPILFQGHPNLENKLSQILIPLQDAADQKMWSTTDLGSVSLKEVYNFQNPAGQ